MAAAKVVLTRGGQTTVPKELREKLGIREGAVFLVEEREGCLVYRPIPALEEFAGADAKYATVEEAKARLDRWREEED